MDYSFILRQLQVLINNNRISFIPIAFVIINLIIFIISRTFRKTGLFVLALAFGIDYTIKSMPFDLYLNYPELYNAVTVLYVIGFIIFFYKVLKMVIRLSNSPIHSKSNSKLRQFMGFTGIGPFLLMLVINIADINKALPQNIINLLTSLAFLFMLIRTIHSTYKYLSTKESIVLADKMDFREIKEFLNEDTPSKKTNSKNQGRQVRKSFDRPPVEEVTEVISKKDVDQADRIKIADISPKDGTKEHVEKIGSYHPSKLSNTDLLKIVAADFDQSNNQTTIAITNLKTSEKISYTSTRPKFSIHENNEYKIDLEFETVNEYDYGRLIDILLIYSKNKDMYKFELIINPRDIPNSKIIFYDPSNIYDIDEKDYANVGGKIISMNFPKYKINFITGN